MLTPGEPVVVEINGAWVHLAKPHAVLSRWDTLYIHNGNYGVQAGTPAVSPPKPLLTKGLGLAWIFVPPWPGSEPIIVPIAHTITLRNEVRG